MVSQARYLTVGELAAQLGVSQSRGYQIARTMDHLRVGKLIRVSREVFEQYTATHLGTDAVASRYGVSRAKAVRIMKLAGGSEFLVDEKHLARFDAQPPADFFDIGSDMVCYFIRARELVKIGYTRDITTRINSMRSDNPFLDLLCTVHGGIDLETRLHAHFHDLRVEGEWFRFSGRLVTFVAEMIGGRPVA